MKKIRAGFFFLATVVFVGLLCYAVFNALAIYIPQRREIRKFEKLKESADVSDAGDHDAANDGEADDGSSMGDSANAADSNSAENASANAASAFPYAGLLARNSDFVGWLSIEDTKIDYPVMKSKEDPEYYLHRDFDGEDSFRHAAIIPRTGGSSWRRIGWSRRSFRGECMNGKPLVRAFRLCYI